MINACSECGKMRFSRLELEAKEGVTFALMGVECQEWIKDIVGDSDCYCSDGESDWQIATPTWFPKECYFPTNAQLDVYYAPQGQWDIGSEWLYHSFDRILIYRITGRIENNLVPYEIIWSTKEGEDVGQAGEMALSCSLARTSVRVQGD